MKRPKMSLLLACGTSLAATAMAVGPAVVGWFTGHYAVFDGMVGLTALTAIAIVWYTYFTSETFAAERRRKDDHRASMATAVLSELSNISVRLDNLATQGPSAATPDFLSTPMLELACQSPELFPAATIQALTGMLRHMADVRETIKTYKGYVSNPTTLPPTSGLVDFDFAVRTRARWADNHAQDLADALIKAGGQLPTTATPLPASSVPNRLPGPLRRP